MSFTLKDLQRLAAPRPKQYNLKRDDQWTTQVMSVSEIISRLEWLYEHPTDITPETIGHEAIRQAVILLSKTVNENMQAFFGLPVFPMPDYVACDHTFNGYPSCDCGRYVNRKTIDGKDHGWAWREVVRRIAKEGQTLDNFTILSLAWKRGLITGFQYFSHLDEINKEELQNGQENVS
jgi:hypothetical protein